MKYHIENIRYEKRGDLLDLVCTLDIEGDGFGPLPFSTNTSDASAVGIDVWRRAKRGEFGSIQTIEIEEDNILPPITKRQLRLVLIRHGISLEQVSQAIEAIENDMARAEAEIEWEDSSSFERNHTTLNLIASNLGLTSEQVDGMWKQALNT